jgi:hypothetical protein
MESLILYSLLTSAAFYLGSRAKITQPIWSRYPPAFARFMDCAACTGFWYGLVFGALLGAYLPIGGIPMGWYVLVVAMCSIVTTPIVAGFMQAGFERLGSAVPDEGDS